MGIKGTVRRNQDGHFIHANIDLDIIITEEVIALIVFLPRDMTSRTMQNRTLSMVTRHSLPPPRLKCLACKSNLSV